jgi:hypothetical protein
LSVSPTDDPAPRAPWRVVGASVAGSAHERANIPCQDAHCCAVLPNGCLIIAVADGAGSAARSEEGARRAVEAAIAHCTGSLQDSTPTDEREWHSIMVAAFDAALAAITAEAEGAHAPLRDYATTLTIVAATDAHLAVGQIGDGIVVAEGNDGLFLAVSPQRGEYANEVALLTSPHAIEGAAIAVFTAAVQAVAATTDGLLRLAVRLPSYEPHAPFFRPLFAFLRETGDVSAAQDELARFLASERIADRTDDDKTLVLAVRAADDEDDTTQPTATEASHAE